MFHGTIYSFTLMVLAFTLLFLATGCSESAEKDPLQAVQEALSGNVDRIEWKQLKHKKIDGEYLKLLAVTGEPYSGWAEKINDNGVRLSFMQIKEGRNEGPAVFWREKDGNVYVHEVHMYKKGWAVGEKISYHPKGSVSEVAIFDDTGAPTSYTRWDETGALTASGTHESIGSSEIRGWKPVPDDPPQERTSRPTALAK